MMKVKLNQKRKSNEKIKKNFNSKTKNEYKTKKTKRMGRWLVMRLTEYFHWITRVDLKLGRRESDEDYTHLTILKRYKQDRYKYQCMIQGKEMVK